MKCSGGMDFLGGPCFFILWAIYSCQGEFGKIELGEIKGYNGYT
jgi:hypothetical protein